MTSRSSSTIRRAVSESSWPVGSSARRSFGVAGERPRDRDPLLLAARHLHRPVARPAREADQVQELEHAPVALAAAPRA